MPYIHVETPGAVSMEEAMGRAWAQFGCEPLGLGGSPDGWSKMNDFQRCAYRYNLAHVMRAVPVDVEGASPALEKGSLFHAVLALHYGRHLPEGYPGWRANPPSPYDFLDAVEAHKAEVSRVHEVRRLYYGYVEFHEQDDLQPVAVEFGGGVAGIHTCRYDMLAWKDGGLWNVEHKTASAEKRDVLEGWWLDGEIIGQMYAWQLSEHQKLFGAPLAGTIINLTIKTHPPKFRRLEVVIPQKVIDSYIRDRAHHAQHRKWCLDNNIWPRSLNGCIGRYDLCAYWDHCRDEDASLIKIGRK